MRMVRWMCDFKVKDRVPNKELRERERLGIHTHTHTHTTILWLSGFCPGQPMWASSKRNIHSLTHTYHGHQSSLICFIHLIWSMASSLFNPRAWQSFSTISLQVFFGLPLGLAPSTSCSIHFFTRSLSSFALHSHTIATCFAVVPRLCHLILVSQPLTWNSVL